MPVKWKFCKRLRAQIRPQCSQTELSESNQSELKAKPPNLAAEVGRKASTAGPPALRAWEGRQLNTH